MDMPRNDVRPVDLEMFATPKHLAHASEQASHVLGRLIAQRLPLRRVALAPDSTISLFRNDGVLLALYPNDGALGQQFPAASLVKLITRPNRGGATGKSVITGQDRIVAAHSV